MSELPRGWLEVPLNEVAEVRLGRQRSPDQVTGDHLRPYLRAANVTWAGIDGSGMAIQDYQSYQRGKIGSAFLFACCSRMRA